MDRIPAMTKIFLAQIMEFPDFSLTFLVFKNCLTNLQNSLTFPWPWRKIKLPWLFPDQWPPCVSQIYMWRIHNYVTQMIGTMEFVSWLWFCIVLSKTVHVNRKEQNTVLPREELIWSIEAITCRPKIWASWLRTVCVVSFRNIPPSILCITR